MDVKSLAKSKRAHTQHHSKKPHPSQKSKGQSGNSKDAGGAKKISVVVEKTQQSRHVPGLPSNWDRYDDDLNSEDQSANNKPSQQSDVVMPKSKGADYSYLISEAESQSQSRTAADYLPYLDDVLPGEFNQALCSMLSVRGEEILSWIGNDNFVVDDDSSVTHEAEFLSLNLHSLANQLEKVDLPTRLFIEPDLLPPELWQRPEQSKARNNLETDGIGPTSKTTRISDELVTKFSRNIKVSDQNTETASSFISESCSVKEVTNSSLFSESNESKTHELKGEYSKPNLTADCKCKTSIFEANAAESELDSLLDSFEIEIHDSPLNDHSEAFMSRPQQSIQGGTGLTQPEVSVTRNFDDVLDDLLGETSDLINPNKTTHLGTQSLSSSQTVTESNVMIDDFDSWLGTL